jgi:MFS family permease
VRISKNIRIDLGSGHVFHLDPKTGEHSMKDAQPARKNVFINLGVFQLLTFVRRGIFYTFMITYLYSLMQSVTYTALLGTLNMVGSSLGQNFLWGRIADRRKLRARLIIAGETTAAIFYFIVFQIHKSLLNAQANFTAGLSLVIGLSILEFFWSMSDVGWASLLSEVTTAKNRTSMVGILNFIGSLGRMVGITFAGYLYNNGEGFSQGTIFYIVITMLIIGAVLMWITSKSTDKSTRKTADEQAENYGASTTIDYDKRAYGWFLISLIVIVIGISCINQVFLVFITPPTGIMSTDPEASSVLTAFTVGGMFMSLACGQLVNRFGKTLVLFSGLIIAIVTPLFYGVASNVLTMALVYGLNGASFWMVLTVGFAFAADIIPEDRRGRLFGRYNTVIALSWGPAGLLVGGPLADIQVKVLQIPAYTAYLNVFYASSIITALGTAIFWAKVSKQKNAKCPSP